MSELNGNNGTKPFLLTRIFGLGVRSGAKNGDSSHVMTFDGAASVNIEKLLKSDDFKKSAEDVKEYLEDGNAGSSPVA